ncbi:MAG: hypothetical protein ABIJ34_02225 [archaeon]
MNAVHFDENSFFLTQTPFEVPTNGKHSPENQHLEHLIDRVYFRK